MRTPSLPLARSGGFKIPKSPIGISALTQPPIQATSRRPTSPNRSLSSLTQPPSHFTPPLLPRHPPRRCFQATLYAAVASKPPSTPPLLPSHPLRRRCFQTTLYAAVASKPPSTLPLLPSHPPRRLNLRLLPSHSLSPSQLSLSLSLSCSLVQRDSSKEPDAASILGDSVQNAMTSGPCEISQKEKQCDPECDTDAGNVKRKSDVSGVEAAVRVGRNIKDSCVVNLEDHPSFVVKELNNLPTLSRHETCILNDNDNCETDQTDGVEEKRESSHNRDPKGMLSEKDKPSSRGETDMNAKEVIVTSKLSDGPGIVEPTKSGKEKRKKRKAEDSEHVKGSEHEISSAEPHKAVNGDHSTDDTKKEERTFSQTKGMEVSKIKTLSTSLLASGGETGDVNGDEVESLQQISKTQANAETMDEKMSKKSKKKQDAAAKNLLDLQTKDQDDNVGILEAYLKSWNSGALDRDATRGSVAYTLVLHHLSSFIFNSYSGDKLSLRNKLVKSLLHDCSHKQHHEMNQHSKVHLEKLLHDCRVYELILG
uniref:Uncharacterized protein n=1 Tax=Fagus sylvatica TaxID=28930 RepID=A0A2N9FYV6_FAGSY